MVDRGSSLARRLSSRGSDGPLDDSHLAPLGPWGSSTPASTPLAPHRPTQHAAASSTRRQEPAPSSAARKISIGPIRPAKALRPAKDRLRPSRQLFPLVPQTVRPPPKQQSPPGHTLKIAKNGHVRAGKLDATPVVQAYEDLLKQTEAMGLEAAENSQQRSQTQAAYRMGLANLSDGLVRRQKELIRFHTLKNEVDIFQQHLVPFVFEMRSTHERQVNSSVYRHFSRMRAIQDLGIPIYSLGDYLLEASDRLLTPRTTHSFYRRVRRRSAAHFIDNELIPRPEPRRRSTVIASAK